MTTKIIPGASAQTSALYAALLDKPVGTRMTYEELSSVARANVTNGGRGYLTSALRRLRNQHRQEWGVERGKGITRLDDGQIVIKAGSELKRGRRVLGKTKRILSCAEYDRLSPEQRKEHDAIVIGARTAELFTGKIGQDKLKATLPPGGKLPEHDRVLEMFRK